MNDMKATARSENRHYLARAKQRVKEHAKIGNVHASGDPLKHECILMWITGAYRNRARCSCSICCNRRRDPHLKRLDKLTMAEKKALLSAKEYEQSESH